MKHACRMVAAIIALGALIAISGCGSSSGSSPTVNLPTPTGQYQALSFEMTSAKQVYNLGEPVVVTLTVTNTGTQPVPFSPSNILVNAGLRVQQETRDIWDSFRHPPIGDGGTGGTGSGPGPPTTIAAGASTTFQLIWTQKTDNGQSTPDETSLPPVAPGVYMLRGYSLEGYYGNWNQATDWFESNFAAPLVTITIQ